MKYIEITEMYREKKIVRKIWDRLLSIHYFWLVKS